MHADGQFSVGGQLRQHNQTIANGSASVGLSFVVWLPNNGAKRLWVLRTIVIGCRPLAQRKGWSNRLYLLNDLLECAISSKKGPFSRTQREWFATFRDV
jgi:hypothetical protein